ncbi:MAG: hypothetical protein Tsb0017_20630 [Geothermobacteraceae bacterium]
MADNRWGKRFPTELNGRFGLQQTRRYGMIRDVSLFGLQISSSVCFPEGSLLAVTIHGMSGKNITLEGRVRWQTRLEQRSMPNKRFGECYMGLQIVRFLEGEDSFRDLCFELCWEHAQKKKMEGSVH